MDWVIHFFGPAMVTVGAVSVVGLIVTARAVSRLRAEKLQSDRALAERIFNLDRALAEKHAAVDRTLAELKSKYDRDLSELNRVTEAAEQAIVQFHQMKHTVDAARSNSFGGEAGCHRPRWKTEEDRELFVFGRVDHIVEEIKQICHPTVRGVMQ
jgi:hypothetical protein